MGSPERRRWLVLLLGLSVLLVATIGVVPHGDEDQSCLACKARHQPLLEIAGMLELDAPPSTESRGPSDDVRFARPVIVDSTAPRAPPA
jgi:hypothetical protein